MTTVFYSSLNKVPSRSILYCNLLQNIIHCLYSLQYCNYWSMKDNTSCALTWSISWCRMHRTDGHIWFGWGFSAQNSRWDTHTSLQLESQTHARTRPHQPPQSMNPNRTPNWTRPCWAQSSPTMLSKGGHDGPIRAWQWVDPSTWRGGGQWEGVVGEAWTEAKSWGRLGRSGKERPTSSAQP